MARVEGFLRIVFLFLANLSLIPARGDTEDYQRREYSLVKPYYDGRWDFQGATIVTNNYVRLTADRQSQAGSIWNTAPCGLRDWEMHVHFKIHGSGSDLFGDGMTIWYAKDRMEPGPVFGSKDYFHGLAIFLDTYSNHNGPHNHAHPYLSAMVNNGTLHYDHDRDGTHTQIAGCESNFRGVTQDTYIAIRYENNVLTVSTDVDGKDTWKECFVVKGIRLPTNYYFGASATTGELADNHDVVSMKLYDLSKQAQDGDEDLSNIVPSADFFTPPRDHVEDPHGGYTSSRLTGWKLFVVIVLGIIGVAVCGMVGYVIFAKRAEDARKRFY
ncbi:hypothetical protein NP493_21g08010 [Ridgeia piscesae]|uniref:L-type lectin-like domain-containing protein n=1 Tax=Ridgeia piscesae TaxID=27915 RepID=A0AAD9PDK6_RIDPI|nr:hypothetical protein NP493_21g08010 [Ridgeia piscesae]